MMKKLGKEIVGAEIYFVSNNNILKGVAEKISNRGTAIWTKIIGGNRKRPILVSHKKIFNTVEEATNYIKVKNDAKKRREEENKVEDRELELLDDYFHAFKMINSGEATYEELKPELIEIERELNSRKRKYKKK